MRAKFILFYILIIQFSQIGHLEAAAGVASIIKAVLMLETGLIPPSIHFNTPNPEIQWDKWNVCVPTVLTSWPTDGVRRISVNSFGYGGANAHAVLEDAHHYLKTRYHETSRNFSNGVIGSDGFNKTNGYHSTNETNGTNGVNGTMDGSNGANGSSNKANGSMAKTIAPMAHSHMQMPRLYVWSAQDKDGLKRIECRLADYIENIKSEHQSRSPHDRHKRQKFMAELAYTLGERRSHLQWKTYGIASSPQDLIDTLTTSNDESRAPGVKSSRIPRVGFVFTGQGAQWPRMGAELMAYKVFRDSIEAADVYLQRSCGCPWSVAEELLKYKSTSLINQALYSHTLSSILQIALVELLKSWDVVPASVVGHSGGEIAASYCAGGLGRTDAWKVAYYRGFVASRMKLKAPELHGAMMAVGMSYEESEQWISKVTDGKLVVACINSPTSTTIAGDSPGIEQLLNMLKAEGVFARKLMVDTAYHSHHMEILADEYRSLIADIKPISAPAGGCTILSTVTGGAIEHSQVGADHWSASITAPVKFSDAIHEMVRPMRSDRREPENAIDILLELGPHSVLQGPSTQSLKAHGIANIPYHSVLTRNFNAIDTAMNVAGALFAQGCHVNIREVNRDGDLHFANPLVDFPTYSWNHSQRFWHDSRVDREFLARDAPKPGLLGAPSPSSTEGEGLWKGFLRLSEAPWISDHKIQGSILYPGAGYIAMAIEAAAQTADKTRKVASFNLRDIQLMAAGIMSEDSDLECIVQLRPHMSGTRDSASIWKQFTVTTSPDGKSLVKNCCGLILVEYEPAEGTAASLERSMEYQSLKAQYGEAQQMCATHLDPDSFYADMRSWGLDYGPAFTNVCEARHRDGQSVGAVQLPEIPIPGITGRPFIIHPATLDAVFHLAFAAVKGGRYDPKTAMVPKSIDAVIVSANIPYQARTVLPGFANACRHGIKELNADIVMFDDNENNTSIVIEGFLCAEIAGASSSTGVTSLTSKVKWKPAIELLTRKELYTILSRIPTGEAKLVEVCVE